VKGLKCEELVNTEVSDPPEKLLSRRKIY